MRSESFEVEADGAALHCRGWWPEAPRAAVQLVHGVGEHGARYEEFARFLAAAGVAAYGHDVRGHGASATATHGFGHYADRNGWARAVSDIARVAAAAAARLPGHLPRFLLGHSMGSLMAQSYAIEHSRDVHGLVLVGSDYRPGWMPRLQLPLLRLWAALAPRHRSRLLNFLGVGVLRYAIPGRRTDRDWISSDPAEVDAYNADPLCGNPSSAALWYDAVTGIIYNSRPANIERIRKDLPVLMLVGADDPLSSGGRRVAALAEAYRRHGLNDVTLIRYPDVRHELLRERNRAQVHRDVLAWIAARL